MPSKPRTPITYEPTTGRMFRPASEVQAERDVLEQGEMEPSETQQPAADSGELDQNEEKNERNNERTNEHVERRVIRHSFDIYHDQLMQLGEIQMRFYRETGKKPKLGRLVQEALDHYIRGENHGRTGHRSVDGEATSS